MSFQALKVELTSYGESLDDVNTRRGHFKVTGPKIQKHVIFSGETDIIHGMSQVVWERVQPNRLNGSVCLLC